MKGVGHRDKKEDKEKVERKQMVEKGVLRRRLDRHPADGLPLKHDPKKGHGGKYSWEGPYGLGSESEPVPAAMDENDPNYVDDEDEDEDTSINNNNRGEKKNEVSGEVETPAVAATGVARIEVDSSALQKSF